MSDGVCHFKPQKGKVVYCQHINEPNFPTYRGYLCDMEVPVSRYVPPSSPMVTTMQATSSSAPIASGFIDLTQEDETLSQRMIRRSHNPEVAGLWEEEGSGGGGGFFAEDEN